MQALRSRAIAAGLFVAVAALLAKSGHYVEAVAIIIAVLVYFVAPITEAAGAGEPLATRLPSPLVAFRRELGAFLAFWVVFAAVLLWRHLRH